MGGGKSKPSAPIAPEQQERQNSPHSTDARTWKVLPSAAEAKAKYEMEGTLTKNMDTGHLELRTLLDDPMAQRVLGAYAKEAHAFESFMFWIDVQEFKGIPTEDYRRSKASHIFQKYIKSGAVLEYGGIEDSDRDRYAEQLEAAKVDKSLLQSNFFDQVQTKCFLDIYQNIFVRFKSTDRYKQLAKDLRNTYNKVMVDDFEIYEKLGKGGFAVVVHARKKTTGKHYALKIQAKRGLFESMMEDPERVNFELQAIASCQHPFIINMDYAFQNEAVVVMALNLATGGDLTKHLNSQPQRRLPEHSVKFYIAQAALAIDYLHQMGIMYRDVKPGNLLIDVDGNLKLADLGGVMDLEGRTLSTPDYLISGSFPFAQKYGMGVADSQQAVNEFEKRVSEKISAKQRERIIRERKLTIMGTFGYMAPEMVMLLNRNIKVQDGYDDRVDWWSLAVTAFVLLTGAKPFKKANQQQDLFVDQTFQLEPDPNDTGFAEYDVLTKPIDFPSHLSADACSFVSEMLQVKESDRLTSKGPPIDMMQQHPFFAGMDFAVLENRGIEPPYVPPVMQDGEPHFESFNEMMVFHGFEEWVRYKPAQDVQKYFSHWDFISPQTLRVEFGIANEMQQYESNAKLRSIFGNIDTNTGTMISTPSI